MAYAFNDDKSKNDLSDFAQIDNLSWPGDSLKTWTSINSQYCPFYWGSLFNGNIEEGPSWPAGRKILRDFYLDIVAVKVINEIPHWRNTSALDWSILKVDDVNYRVAEIGLGKSIPAGFLTLRVSPYGEGDYTTYPIFATTADRVTTEFYCPDRPTLQPENSFNLSLQYPTYTIDKLPNASAPTAPVQQS